MEKMNRPAPYVDASVNRYAASQMQQMSAQRIEQNARMNNFSGQSHMSSRADGRQQWDMNPQIEMNPMSPHSFSQGHEGNAGRSLSQERMADQKYNYEKDQKYNYENQANNDPRMQSYEQDMEIGYEDNKPSELTFEGLEQKFQDEIMKLVKEMTDAEDAENARHRERIVEINTRYQVKLSSLRVQQATRIGEFLQKESDARLHQYQQAGIPTHLPERGPADPRDYGWMAAAEGPRAYGTGPNDNYREQQPQYRGARRSQGSEVRVPYPQGRVYNNSGARYY